MNTYTYNTNCLKTQNRIAKETRGEVLCYWSLGSHFCNYKYPERIASHICICFPFWLSHSNALRRHKFSTHLSIFSKGPFCLLPLCSATVVCPHFKWIAVNCHFFPLPCHPQFRDHWVAAKRLMGRCPTFFMFFFHQLRGFHFRISSWVVTGEYTTSSPHHKVGWGCASTTLSGNLSLAKGMNFKSNVNQSSMIQHVSTIKKKSWLHHLVVETPWTDRGMCPSFTPACHSCQCRDGSNIFNHSGRPNPTNSSSVVNQQILGALNLNRHKCAATARFQNMHIHVHAVYNIVYNDTNASPNISNHVVEHPQSISVQVCVSFGGFFVPFASINNPNNLFPFQATCSHRFWTRPILLGQWLHEHLHMPPLGSCKKWIGSWRSTTPTMRSFAGWSFFNTAG